MSFVIGTQLRRRAAKFAREFWIYVLLAGVLTTIIASITKLSDPAQVSVLLVGNLLISTTIGLACELARALVLVPEPLARLSRARRILLGVPVFGVAVFSGAELGVSLAHALLPTSEAYFQQQAVLLISAPTALVMIGVGALRELSIREQGRREDAELQLKVARLSALSARTDPHFLFNSLNSIAALIADDPELAERAVLSLAALFRYVLEGSSATHVALGDELAFVRAYLALEGLRYADRLTVSIDVAPSLSAVQIPPLILQPLVENALRHGLAARPERLTIAVQISAQAGQLTITVDDDGPGPGASQHRGARTSQADLQQRLALAYGSRARFETGRSPLGGFRAMLELPGSPHESADRRR